MQQAVGARVMAAAQAELARRDVNTFCEFVMRDPKGRPWQQAAFHREWHRLLPEAGPSRSVIVAPRGSAKNSQLSVARVLWELGRNPELRIKLVCSTDDLASKLLGEVSRTITHNRRLRLVFPQLRPDPQGPWTRTQLRVVRAGLAKDPSVEAHGVLSAGVGGRADVLVCDDICDQRTAVLQPAMRDQIKRVFYETWLPLLGPEGRAVYVATVWHPSDLTVELRDSGHWTIWWRGARDELTGELLWPEVWSEEALRRTESEIGSRAFARQFLLQAVSDEERLFSADAIARCRDVRYVVGRLPAPQGWRIFAGCRSGRQRPPHRLLERDLRGGGEPAAAAAAGGDPSLPGAALGGGRSHRGGMPALAAPQGRGGEQRLPAGGAGPAGRDDPKLPLQGYRTGAEKADDQIGLPALAAAVDRGDWIIPAGGVPHGGGCACAYCAWQRKLLLYPAAEHADTVMGMWFAEIAARDAVRAGTYCYPSPKNLKTVRLPFHDFISRGESRLRDL
jgi:hypothetical protein